MSLYLFDHAYREAGYSRLCGVDEAGRGPLAGPVCAAAVILSPDAEIEGVRDSKLLSPKRRERLSAQIQERACAWAVAFASRDEIDERNILQATLLAMRRAVQALPVSPDLVLVDGNADPGFAVPTKLVVKGDAASACIAAASILAKTARDRLLIELDARYPAYAFAKHKGYGTKLHYERLDAYGPCPEHRRSFLKKWEARKTGANLRGALGEDYACALLNAQAYAILDRNFHSRYGEVDLVAAKDEFICFVEVKTRKRNAMVSGAQAVDQKKQLRIIRTALCWMQMHPEYDLQPRFDVCVVETGSGGEALAHDYIEGAFDAGAYENQTNI